MAGKFQNSHIGFAFGFHAMRLPTAFLLEAAETLSSIIHRRAIINYDAVVPFDQRVPAGPIGALYLTYQPFLDVVNGCVPFPAVGPAGNTGGGLAPTAPSNGRCSQSKGQVYARSSSYINPNTSVASFAIYYSWYMPKDNPCFDLGHRHDWEGIVVWLSDNTTSAKLRGVSASAHGGFQKTKLPPVSGKTHPLISYFSPVCPINHQTGFTLIKGGMQPLIAWESLTVAARNALQTTDFGSATVPFKDSTLRKNLDKAALD